MFFVTLFALFTAFAFLPGSFSAHSARYHRRAAAHSLVHSRALRLQTAFLDAHNAVRVMHNATTLTWSTELAEKAEKWTDACQFKHTEGVLSDTPYGEIIAAATGSFPVSAAFQTFVRDEAAYNPANPTFTHFTQVVWKNTTQLGCAASRCSGIFDKSLGTATLYVCLYDPVGNVIGEALDNVQV
ncbi:CAP domain-containing protein [Crucibulum laeve]|uniref:CAP domain-containing protein n=1 Tax=Crucibulum laeve TaxID=68775 RepID=A0A5C3MIK1_9AGAR|nr:CAP domain-containing protein [Crucibulum laeve]